uniref:Uncharacterized protein n=1 Tax=Siphoviridae sp. ctES717 TaxID=2827564 RepID=A0A8S5RSJ7_9CAUD|nr:MAG TPA: hypothetical protein [Siphoviridae sp. ctES717]
MFDIFRHCLYNLINKRNAFLLRGEFKWKN